MAKKIHNVVNTKKNPLKVGKINLNEVKSRDIVHMQEFLRGAGGAHKSKKDYNRRDNRKVERDWA